MNLEPGHFFVDPSSSNLSLCRFPLCRQAFVALSLSTKVRGEDQKQREERQRGNDQDSPRRAIDIDLAMKMDRGRPPHREAKRVSCHGREILPKSRPRIKPMFTHEKLIVYQKALDFAGLSSALVLDWDKRHSIVDHLPRAAESIVLNLAEGARLAPGRWRLKSHRGKCRREAGGLSGPVCQEIRHDNQGLCARQSPPRAN